MYCLHPFIWSPFCVCSRSHLQMLVIHVHFSIFKRMEQQWISILHTELRHMQPTTLAYRRITICFRLIKTDWSNTACKKTQHLQPYLEVSYGQYRDLNWMMVLKSDSVQFYSQIAFYSFSAPAIIYHIHHSFHH